MTEQTALIIEDARAGEAREDSTAAGAASPLGIRPLLEFTVHGKPAPQGSKSAFRNKYTGRISQVETSKRVKPWREAVKSAALDEHAELNDWQRCQLIPLTNRETPVRVDVVFTFDKPVSAPKRRRTWPTTRSSGDIDKCLRSVLDAVTDSGVAWRDDSQIVEAHARKVFAGEDPVALSAPGARIRIYDAGSVV